MVEGEWSAAPLRKKPPATRLWEASPGDKIRPPLAGLKLVLRPRGCLLIGKQEPGLIRRWCQLKPRLVREVGQPEL